MHAYAVTDGQHYTATASPLDAVSTAYANAETGPCRLLIIPRFILDEGAGEEVALTYASANIAVDRDRYPTFNALNTHRRSIEKFIDSLSRLGQLPLPGTEITV